MNFNLRLEEVAARLYAFPETPFESVARKHLKPARHVFELRPQQQVGQNSSAATDDLSFERAVLNLPSRAKAAAENAVVAFQHLLEKLRNVRGLMTEARINLQNPIAARAQSLSIAANVSVNRAPVLRRPDDL